MAGFLVRPPGEAPVAEVLNLIFEDVAVVLVERLRELVRPVVAAHEIQGVGRGGVSGGLER